MYIYVCVCGVCVCVYCVSLYINKTSLSSYVHRYSLYIYIDYSRTSLSYIYINICILEYNIVVKHCLL